MDALDIAIAEGSEQRSQNWIDARLGRFTASEFWKLMSTPRGKTEEHLTDTAITYIEEKVAEILTNQKKVVTGWALEWGIDQEPNAIAAYEKKYGYKITPACFVTYGEHAGGTTDGYMPMQMVEVKCPYNSEHHVQYLQITNALDLKIIEPKYFWQIQFNLLINAKNGIKEAVFISYDPRVITERLKVHDVVIEPDLDAFELMGIKLGAAIKLKESLLNQFGIK